MILVAGGTGFLGRHIVAALRASGEDVAILTRRPDEARSDSDFGDVTVRSGDITDPPTLLAALEGCDTVIMAAQFKGHPVERRRRGLTYDAVDRAGTEALVSAAKATGRARPRVEEAEGDAGRGRRRRSIGRCSRSCQFRQVECHI